jgi:hypothetical protein
MANFTSRQPLVFDEQLLIAHSEWWHDTESSQGGHRMLAALRVIFILIALFFAVGAVLTWRGEFDSATYIAVTGVVGSIASVIGLVALGAPRLTATDVRRVEADLFKTIAEQARAAKEYDEKLVSNRQELTKLEKERAEIELLVRQASLKVFLEEQLRYIATEIDKRLEGDITLNDLIGKYGIARKRVEEINGQIERSDKADTIQQILQDVRSTDREGPSKIYVKIMGNRVDIGPGVHILQKLFTEYANAVRRTFP